MAQERDSVETAEGLLRAARLAEALDQYQRLLMQAEQTGDLSTQAAASLGLGRTYYWLSQPERALPVLMQARELYATLEDGPGLAATVMEIAIATVLRNSGYK